MESAKLGPQLRNDGRCKKSTECLLHLAKDGSWLAILARVINLQENGSLCLLEIPRFRHSLKTVTLQRSLLQVSASITLGMGEIVWALRGIGKTHASDKKRRPM